MSIRLEEIRRIREWSEAIERNPFAFGPSIDKNKSIKVLLAHISELESACEAAQGWIQSASGALTCLDHDQPTHCVRCDLRHASKKLVEQLEGAIKHG